MALIYVNQATSIALLSTTGKTAALAWTLRLFSNDYVPVHTSTEANLTEVTGGGYAAIALTSANWTAVPGDPSSIGHPVQVFEFSGAIGGSGIVYGYYTTDANGKLQFAERLSVPPTITPGFTVNVTLNLTEASVA